MRESPNAVVRFLTLLGRHEFGVLLAFAGVGCGLWLFTMISAHVIDGSTQAIDQRLLLAMRHPDDLSPIGPPVVQEAARDITALGGIFVLSSLTLLTGGFLFLDGKRHMALFVYLSVISGTLVSLGLKNLFQRPRPELVPYASDVLTASFPSGHSMISAVVYLTLGALLARSQSRKRLKAYFLLLAALLTMIIGVSRVYLGVHWPTDILAGWTAGASWAIICWVIARMLQRRHSIEAASEHVAID